MPQDTVTIFLNRNDPASGFKIYRKDLIYALENTIDPCRELAPDILESVIEGHLRVYIEQDVKRRKKELTPCKHNC